MRTLRYYVGTTLDGFIAAPDGATSFFAPDEEVLGLIAREFPDTLPTHVRGPAGLGPQADRFDAVVMGRITYEPAVEQDVPDPYGHLRTYVVSSTLGPSAQPNVDIVHGDPVRFIRALKRQAGGDLWLAAGSWPARSCRRSTSWRSRSTRGSPGPAGRCSPPAPSTVPSGR
jgi:dihydrofolate reductase